MNSDRHFLFKAELHFLDYLRNVNDVMEILVSKSCLTIGRMEDIMKISPLQRTRVREFMSACRHLCLDSSTKFFNTLVEALRETNNGLLADLLVAPPNQPLSITHPERHPVKFNMVKLTEYLDNVEEVVNVMKAKKCLTKLQAETILYISPIRAEKVRELTLTMCCYPPGHEVFNGFLAALRETNNGELADAIEPAC